MNKDRDDMFDAIDQAIKGEWDMPEELEQIDWVHKMVDPSFAITVEASIRILDDVNPEITIQPYDPLLGDADLADQHEKGVKWLLDGASRRRAATVVQDIIASACKYAEVGVDVVYLPQQIKDIKAAGGNAKRYEAMNRKGPFAVIVHNPRNVYPRYSDYGLEECAIEEMYDPHDIVDLWGTKADELKKRVGEMKTGTEPLMVKMVDYMSYDWRAVWVEPEDGGDIIELVREEWKWPFLPRVVRMGGTNIEKDSDHARRPFLANMYHFDMYDTMNRVRTLRVSDMIRTAATPRSTFVSDTRKAPDIDASTGDLHTHITTDEQLADRRQWPADPAMTQLYGELQANHQEGTLSKLLLGGDIPAGAAFASINLVTHSALAALKTPRRLAARTVADVIETMLLWLHYSEDTAVAYYTGVSGETESFLIDGKDVVPENLYVNVELRADLPTDSQSRTVTARAQIDAGLNSRAGAMGDIGIQNVTEVQEQLMEERLLENMLQTEMRNDTFMADQQIRQQMQQEVMQQLMQDPQFIQQMMQMAQQGMQGGPPQADRRMGEPPRGVPQMGGEQPPETLIPSEANPAMGGPVPAEYNPAATRELQTQTGPRGESTAVV
jgi:hypothetical protein